MARGLAEEFSIGHCALMLKVSGVLRVPSALLRLLRRDAHWRQTSVTAAVGSGIGLVNDVFSPIAQFYALLFGV
ncbi:MAG: hypothetical protein AAGA39_07600, partial [Pseudomonadota bacterium]